MNALHEQFVAEARELIQQATDDLIALEREGFATERIDSIFRAFHTLKGSAGVVELSAMSLTLHAAEDLLAAIHGGQMAATPDVIDRALACLDQVSRWVNDFDAEGSLPAHAGEDARSMAEQLRDLLPESSRKIQRPSVGHSAIAASGQLSEWAAGLIASQRAKVSEWVRDHPTGLFAVSYEPHAGCFFDGADPLQLMRQVPSLLAFHIEEREPWPQLADLDPFACNLRLQCIAGGNRAELARIFLLVPDQVRIVEVPLQPSQLKQRAQSDRDMTDLVRAVIEEQRQMLRISAQGEHLIGRIGAAARAAANALRYEARPDLAEPIERAGATATSQGTAAPLLSALEETLEPFPLGTPAADQAAARNRELSGSTPDESLRSASRSLRVAESKIDALVNLAGELVVVKNGLAHLAKRVEAETGAQELARAVRREQEAFDRLTGEMHAAILQLRMVPIGQVFRSFPRLVRDMSRELNKKVELVTRGETTESDKIIIDLLFEPLLHLVRNALDHGIESPAQRRSVGKSEVATITMEASRIGDRLMVEVIDDGRGVDPDIVKRKARERELLAADELAALSDEEAVNLIFSAGFSTAAEVSDISGRGVGMDVVRTTAERIGGRVSLSSRVGAGTTIRLDLPLNIAMSRIMVVEAGGQVFGIPMEAVTETVRLTPERISQIKTNEGFVLRNRIVPICSLAELMNLPKKPASELAARLLVVTETAGKVAALEVDAIRDRLEVVLKPLQGLLSNARGYAGTTLLGDGGVLLVLDLKEIVP
jgi:two-component system, chemotaxis family, sensor kinase CheA